MLSHLGSTLSQLNILNISKHDGSCRATERPVVVSFHSLLRSPTQIHNSGLSHASGSCEQYFRETGAGRNRNCKTDL